MAKLIDFLVWIETTPHHIAQLHETSKGRGLRLKGHRGVSVTLMSDGKEQRKLYESARDPFDSRMYRATAKGRKLIREAGRWPEVATKQARRKDLPFHAKFDRSDLSDAAWEQDVANYNAKKLNPIALQEKWGARGLYFK